jgi:hypothetical protein
MSKLNKLLSLLMVITFVILACNLPVAQPAGVQPPLGTPDYAATITAQAELLQSPPGNQPTPSGQNQTPAAPAQIPLTDTPTLTPTITMTPSPTIPMVSVSLDTNCRTGPGKEYDYLGALLTGETAEVVGKNTETGYWIIKNPDGAGTCWLWGQYATVSGNTGSLQEYAIPSTPTPSPTPTLAPPKPPKNLTANKVCIPMPGPIFQYTGTLTWVDNADNEDGYNIYMNGGLFVSLPANSNVAPLPGIPMPPGTPLTMGVESYNAAGKSAMKTVVVVCP